MLLPEELGSVGKELTSLRAHCTVFCFQYSPSTDVFPYSLPGWIDPDFWGSEVYVILGALLMKNNIKL